ncbi:MerR family transcriptional regulator [Microbacterium sp. zg.B48]|uniref:helix-turn-helix domain-containing protein n=1 Tax=unclassified Microbacterium TaxID=2609290 RepID=UPI00214B7937|nr:MULTISPECIES: MerR family transcriptional regulator [unclassified Microbacterium]MCR2762804.1 MerR family transcriptional regulator [Microbacterium sp. zg.B48]MCR2808362.1 MerR family transcriptional regulator [Microbacterium sp. zg.B185]WIM19190.1 MerR family transcriptional regulator [Microbacterium sp. zg-B185]
MKSSPIPIGVAAARFGLDTHVLRHWEDVGLLRPDRDAAGRRRYGDRDLVRIAVILRSKAAGMTLEQIGVLLDEQAPSRHRVLEQHIEDLSRRMAEMERSREMTLHALNCRSHDISTCPRFRTIVGGVIEGTASWSLDPHDAEIPQPLSTGHAHVRRVTASTG